MATPAVPPNPGPAPTSTENIRGVCSCCQSPIFVEGGVVKGGDPSAFFLELQAKAQSADEWRNKAAALEHEHTSRDIHEPPPAPVPPPNADPEVEYFL